MFREPTTRVHATHRRIPIAIVAALFAVALMAVLLPAASAAPAVPHFSPSVQVDHPPAYTAGNPSMAVGTDGVAYLAFAGWGGAATQSDIFFSKSTDGRTWTVPIRVNNDVGGAAQSDPSLALDSRNNITITWTDGRNGNPDIFFSKSTDGGLSFSANVRVNDVTTNAQTESDLAVDPVDSHLIHVVWTDTRSLVTGPDIYYANSTDGGLSFNPSVRVNNDATGVEQGQPAIAVGPNRDVYIVWRDPRNAARGFDIYFSMSSDLGMTWSPNIFLNDDTGAALQQEPTIAVDAAGTIYVAWTDYRSGNTAPDIEATRSTNAGASFAANVKVNDDTGPASQSAPSLATNAGKVQLAWADTRTVGSTSWDIYTASSTDGLTWSVNMKVNDDSLSGVFQFQPSIAVDARGDVFAAWLDTRMTGQDVFANVLDVVAPTANAGAAITVDQGLAASFDGSGSTDNLGIATYSWDFGDGSTAAGMTANHTYPNAGTFTARLTVWDYSGNAATSTRSVTVRDIVSPVARGGGDRTVDEGQPLFFDASASSDNVGVVSYSWSFGDGSSASAATATHIYARPGAYNATLTVTDAAGNAATTRFTVTVRSNALLGMIQLLEGIIAALALVLALLAWIVLGIRKREKKRGRGPMGESASQPPAPPREGDPIDMALPPAPPPQGP